ncbi:hypothetical protein KKH23_09050 [Patescibacteria group bacterium]|nr:hypothetical protein [Patescibacteria group bacterium]
MGYYLKFYRRGREEFKEEYAKIIPTQRDVVKIVNRLCRHYKLSTLKVTFNKRKPDSGAYWKRSRRVDFHRTVVSFGIVCHEVGHHMAMEQTGKCGHTKKLMVRIRRLVKYCRKKKFWGI